MKDIRSLFKDGAVFYEEDIIWLQEYLQLKDYFHIKGREERMRQLKMMLEDIVDFSKID